MQENKKSLWEQLRNKYKIAIINDTTYEEIFGGRVSMLHGVILLAVVTVIVTATTIILIAYTNLREFIPGYPSGETRQQIVDNLLRTDSLAYELYKRDEYIHSIRRALGVDTTHQEQKEGMEQNTPLSDTIQFNLTAAEQQFRNEIEEQERFNLAIGDAPKKETEYYHFFPPVEGIVTQAYDERKRHFGTDIATKTDAKVNSVLDGVVIFSEWTLNTGYVVQIQHRNNLVSIYKHNAVLLKKQGDYVRGGEVIGMVGNTGEVTTGPHLHFELWRAGNPLNPEDFIKFE